MTTILNYSGLTCFEVTGDSDSQVDFRALARVDIILTTPEKWDSITRKWKEITFFLKLVGLIIIDEVHLLNETRGATLEAVVSRMKMLNDGRKEHRLAPIRFLALSATIPNIDDIGDWLGAPVNARRAYGIEYRPVKVR